MDLATLQRVLATIEHVYRFHRLKDESNAMLRMEKPRYSPMTRALEEACELLAEAVAHADDQPA